MKLLAVVTRDSYIESLHYGYICVVDSSGQVLYHLGDYNTKIFFRSAAKPIQIIPLLQSGAAQAFDFSKKEIALACSSHSGQKIHQDTVENILSKLRMKEENLHCGIMDPYSEEENKRLIEEGKSPTVLHCSCSGKHSAMLALAKYSGYKTEDYENINNPTQQEILKTIAEFTGEDAASIPIGTDGCSAPIYLLPINKIALSYARLVLYSQNPESPYYDSCRTVFEAMTQYPEMVAGNYEFCTDLMHTAKNKLIGKVGCEAVYCIGIKEGNLGVCIKIADGNERAVYPVVVQLLKELGVLSESELNSLKNWHIQAIKNNLGEITGKIIPSFNLKSRSETCLSPGMIYKL